MAFKTPLVLMCIPCVLIFVWWRLRQTKPGSFRFSSLDLLRNQSMTWRVRFRFFPDVLRWISIVLMFIALAGPRKVMQETIVSSEGINIVLAVDASTSMKAEDFVIDNKRRNRLFVVKKVIQDFVDRRNHDRIALIAFAAQAYTVCPLTTDHDWLKTNLDRIDFGFMEDGTAIGSAISAGVSRLRDSDAKSNIVILLTDGINTVGTIDPLTAAKAAQALGVKIYTIGAGTRGVAPYPVQDFFGRTVYRQIPVKIDEASLQEVAKLTGGEYFRATDTQSLEEIYERIDKLEKTKIEETGFLEYEELFSWFLVAALLLLFTELILRNTVFLRIP